MKTEIKILKTNECETLDKKEITCWGVGKLDWVHEQQSSFA